MERIPGRVCLTAGPSHAHCHLAWILALPRSRFETFLLEGPPWQSRIAAATFQLFTSGCLELAKSSPDNSASSPPWPLLGAQARLRSALRSCAFSSSPALLSRKGSPLAGAPSSDHSSPRIEKWVRVKTKIDTIPHPLPSLEQPPGKPLPTPARSTPTLASPLLRLLSHPRRNLSVDAHLSRKASKGGFLQLRAPNRPGSSWHRGREL